VTLSSGKGQDLLCSHATLVPHQVDFNAKLTPLGLIQVEGHVKGMCGVKLNIGLNLIKHVVKGFIRF